MRTKVTVALLLLNAVLFYYIFYVREHNMGGSEQSTILGSEASNIQTLSIETNTPGESTSVIRLERKGDNWMMTSPVEWPANAFAVRPIIADLQRLHSETSFAVKDLAQNGQTLADYGLENPERTLVFTPAATVSAPTPAPVTLKIGATTKTGNRLYILSPDGQRVHVVLRTLADSLAVTRETLRADTLFTIPVFEARSLNIEPASGIRVRFRRDNDRWLIEAPIQARASKTRTEIAINSLGGLRVKRFLDTPDVARAMPTTPAYRVTLEGNNRSETLLIGPQVETAKAATTTGTTTAPASDANVAAGGMIADASEPATEYYAQLDNRKTPFTVLIPDRLMTVLRDAQQDLRERRILDIDPSAVSAITITAAGQNEVTLQRLDTTLNSASAPWQIVRRSSEHGPQITPADHDAVDRLINRLARLSVQQDSSEEKGFINDAPSDAEKETYGFTARPAREITITVASPAPQAGGTVAPPVSVTLQIGTGTDRRTYARVTNQNYIYRVSPDILDDTPDNSLAYRDHLILERELPSGAQVTALKITDLASSTAIVDTSFPQPVPSTSDAAGETRRLAIESLAAQLRTLRAHNFVADEFSKSVFVGGEERAWRYRLEATITLGGTGADAQAMTMELFIAPRTGGTTQYLGSPRYNVVFEAEQPVIDALQTLIYGPRDPGPQTTSAAPAQPTPAPPAQPKPQ